MQIAKGEDETHHHKRRVGEKLGSKFEIAQDLQDEIPGVALNHCAACMVWLSWIFHSQKVRRSPSATLTSLGEIWEMITIDWLPGTPSRWGQT